MSTRPQPMAKCQCPTCRAHRIFTPRGMAELLANLAVLVLIIAMVLVLLALYGAPPSS